MKEFRTFRFTISVDDNETGKIVNMQPLCAIDDLFSVQQALSRHNIATIIIAHPWNNYIGENMQRVSDIDQFIESFEYVCPSI